MNWSKLWGLSIPQKVKYFVWRACKEVIATRGNNRCRNIDIDPACPMCRSHRETINLCLHFCECIAKTWFASHLAIRTTHNVNISFARWFMNWFIISFPSNNDRTETISFIVILSWFIWKVCNAYVKEKLLLLLIFSLTLIGYKRTLKECLVAVRRTWGYW